MISTLFKSENEEQQARSLIAAPSSLEVNTGMLQGTPSRAESQRGNRIECPRRILCFVLSSVQCGASLFIGGVFSTFYLTLVGGQHVTASAQLARSGLTLLAVVALVSSTSHIYLFRPRRHQNLNRLNIAFSGTLFYDYVTCNMYAVVYTALPILLYGTYDRDISAETCLR